ncbi:hypothetical protein C451_04626 [Halococcus thailandensis JCM 13552]|uniref:Uncharacterized protein n=1 Tax=Halococcus thailandensis JCM 13552 TaxID=1227457 RepID=M0NHA3_9EURY|nr:hypothetical protein C451_04626 [Halococcus thailandensis JCM 13552]
MPTYRFRVKSEYDPTSLWRDIAVVRDRTLDEFQTVLNRAVGLNQDHLWFSGPTRTTGTATLSTNAPKRLSNQLVDYCEAGRSTTLLRRQSGR